METGPELSGSESRAGDLEQPPEAYALTGDVPPVDGWYVAMKDNAQGPLTVDDLKERWARGEIGADTLCWREGMGECEAAASGHLPILVEQADLRGLLHCHTNYSDGASTVAEWAQACRAAGYEWIGITDHSVSSPYAGGLAPSATAPAVKPPVSSAGPPRPEAGDEDERSGPQGPAARSCPSPCSPRPSWAA